MAAPMKLVLDEMKDYLTVLNYPDISICDVDDMAEIFAPGNRKKLLTWALSQLSDAITIPLEEEQRIQYMADQMNEWGFCKSKDKVAFVLAELNIREQFIIFSRLFTFLVEKELQRETDENIAKKDLFALSQNIVKYSAKLKQQIVKSIGSTMDELKHEDLIRGVDALKLKFDQMQKVDDLPKPSASLNGDVLQNEMAEFSANCDVLVNSTPLNTASNLSLDPDASSKIRTIQPLLENTLKRFTAIKTLSDHNKITESNNATNDDAFDMDLERLENILNTNIKPS